MPYLMPSTNNALHRLDTGRAIFVEAQREPGNGLLRHLAPTGL